MTAETERFLLGLWAAAFAAGCVLAVISFRDSEAGAWIGAGWRRNEAAACHGAAAGLALAMRLAGTPWAGWLAALSAPVLWHWLACSL